MFLYYDKRVPWISCLSKVVSNHSLDKLTLRAFCQKCIVHILKIFRLDMRRTSFNLLKWGFATWQYAFPSTSIDFNDIFSYTRACTEIKMLRFWTRNWHKFCLRLFCLILFLDFPFSPFLILLLLWLIFYWAWESILIDAPIFEYFHPYFRLHWA